MLIFSARPQRDRGSANRGFTLTELLAVLAMLSVLVVAASPSFVRAMRDRRVARAAMTIVDYIRTARTTAIGHGQPILFRWSSTSLTPQKYADATAGTGSVQIVEPIVTTGATTTTCSTTAWNTAATQVVSTFDIQSGYYSYTGLTFLDDNGNAAAYAEICFATTGRMYLRTSTTTPFHVVLGVPTFGVYNLQNNPAMANLITTRRVLIPQNGVARLAL